MANIATEIKNFLSAIYGKDVRASLVSMAEKLNYEVENNTTVAKNAANSANEAASNANEAAANANEATERANTAASEAEDAAINANEAAEKVKNLSVVELEEEVAQVKSELTEETAERKAEIAVERERINQFTRLGEGSTTGDAELLDARIDKDGNTHANVGEHIRNVTIQFSNISKLNILKYEKYKPNTFLENVIGESTMNSTKTSSVNNLFGIYEISDGVVFQTPNTDDNMFLYLYDVDGILRDRRNFKKTIPITCSVEGHVIKYVGVIAQLSYGMLTICVGDGALTDDYLEKARNGYDSHKKNLELESITNKLHNNVGVSVKDFGAVGDGETDDSDSILKALQTGHNVYFPSGIYRVTKVLHLPTKTKIHGDGASSVILYDGNVTNEHVVSVNINSKNCIIENLTINGNNKCKGILDGAGNTSNPQNYSTRLYLSNILFNNCKVAISNYAMGSDYNRILAFGGNGGENGIDIHMSDNRLNNCRFYQFKNYGVYCKASSNGFYDVKCATCGNGFYFVQCNNLSGNIEAQENYKDNIIFNNVAVSNFTVNSCGAGCYEKDGEISDGEYSLIKIIQCTALMINGSALSNTEYSERYTHETNVIKFDGTTSKNCVLNLTYIKGITGDFVPSVISGEGHNHCLIMINGEKLVDVL